MLIKALICAAAASTLATAALAQDNSNDRDVTAPSASQSQGPAATENSVPATAVTPSANVASSTTTIDADGAVVTNQVITNGPVPDTPENRARYGQPLSHAGRMTAPRGN
jgi:hypothetical protein